MRVTTENKIVDYYVQILEDEKYFIENKIQVFLFCFDLSNIDSFYNIKEKYFPLMNQIRNKKSINLLIGTKSDKNSIIKEEDVLNLKNELNSFRYLEVSSKNNHNLKQILSESVTGYVEFLLKHKKPIDRIFNFEDNAYTQQNVSIFTRILYYCCCNYINLDDNQLINEDDDFISHDIEEENENIKLENVEDYELKQISITNENSKLKN
jgi:hypothetical protein